MTTSAREAEMAYDPPPAYNEISLSAQHLDIDEVEPELPHAPLPLRTSATTQSSSSKWSSPRSVFSIESGNFSQQLPSVSSTTRMPGSGSGVRTSGQLSGFERSTVRMPGSVSGVRTSGQLSRFGRAKPPQSYMVASVITMLCCCFCIGIAAVFQSTDVEVAINEGDMERAYRASRSAVLLNIIGIAIGAVIITSVITTYALGAIRI